MDRQIVYPGSIPLDTDLLSVQQATLVALGALAQATLGSGVVADGLACTPTVPPSLTISVAPGTLFQLAAIEATAFGSLPALTTSTTLKAGINITASTFTVVPPVTAGTAIAYLVQASFTEFDTDPVVLPYYNAAAPAQPFVGPGNAGTSQNTKRVQRVGLSCKPGVAAASGTQTPPAADPGWIGLFVVTVAYGQTEITASSIAPLAGAPFLPFKLPQLTPGFSRQAVFGPGAAGWTAPAGITAIRVQIVGAGGGGGGGNSTYSGGGGGAGGYAQGIFGILPGTVIPVSVGQGGSGSPAGTTGATGGTTSVGALLSASGGLGGASNNPDSHGGAGGQGSGGSINQQGGYGTDGFPAISTAAGAGGASFFGGGGRGASGGGVPAIGTSSGSGGGGGYGSTCSGGPGAGGLAIIEY